MLHCLQWDRFRRLSRNNVKEYVSSICSSSTVAQKPQSQLVKVEEKVVGSQRGDRMARRGASELSVSPQNERLSVNRSYFLKRPKQ